MSILSPAIKFMRMLINGTEVDASNPLPVEGTMQLSGSNMEYFAAGEGGRPDADSVPVGAVVMAVDTSKVWQSDGATWRPL